MGSSSTDEWAGLAPLDVPLPLLSPRAPSSPAREVGKGSAPIADLACVELPPAFIFPTPLFEPSPLLPVTVPPSSPPPAALGTPPAQPAPRRQLLAPRPAVAPPRWRERRTVAGIRPRTARAIEARAIRAEKKKKSGTVKWFTCRRCDVSCTSQKSFFDHLNSRGHAKSTKPPERRLWCEPCEKELESPQHFEVYLRGKAHQRVVVRWGLRK